MSEVLAILDAISDRTSQNGSLFSDSSAEAAEKGLKGD